MASVHHSRLPDEQVAACIALLHSQQQQQHQKSESKKSDGLTSNKAKTKKKSSNSDTNSNESRFMGLLIASKLIKLYSQNLSSTDSKHLGSFTTDHSQHLRDQLGLLVTAIPFPWLRDQVEQTLKQPSLKSKSIIQAQNVLHMLINILNTLVIVCPDLQLSGGDQGEGQGASCLALVIQEVVTLLPLWTGWYNFMVGINNINPEKKSNGNINLDANNMDITDVVFPGTSSQSRTSVPTEATSDHGLGSNVVVDDGNGAPSLIVDTLTFMTNLFNTVDNVDALLLLLRCREIQLLLQFEEDSHLQSVSDNVRVHMWISMARSVLDCMSSNNIFDQNSLDAVLLAFIGVVKRINEPDVNISLLRLLDHALFIQVQPASISPLSTIQASKFWQAVQQPSTSAVIQKILMSYFKSNLDPNDRLACFRISAALLSNCSRRFIASNDENFGWQFLILILKLGTVELRIHLRDLLYRAGMDSRHLQYINSTCLAIYQIAEGAMRYLFDFEDENQEETMEEANVLHSAKDVVEVCIEFLESDYTTAVTPASIVHQHVLGCARVWSCFICMQVPALQKRSFTLMRDLVQVQKLDFQLLQVLEPALVTFDNMEMSVLQDSSTILNVLTCIQTYVEKSGVDEIFSNKAVVMSILEMLRESIASLRSVPTSEIRNLLVGIISRLKFCGVTSAKL